MVAVPRFPTHSHVSERRQRGVYIAVRYSKSISTTGGQWKYHFHHAITQTSSILKKKMSIEGKRGARKGRERESRGERWCNVEGLQDLRESGHAVVNTKVWSFLSSERAKIQALGKAVAGGNEGLQGEWNCWRMFEITLSQKEKIPHCQDETASNCPDIIEELMQHLFCRQG